jgi:hypothetical protein
VAQCEGTTKKGERCKREAPTGARFCAIHQDQAVRPRRSNEEVWDADAVLKAAIGFGLVAAIFLYRFRR